MSDRATLHFIKRGDDEYERVVMCELLIPNVPNSYGDIYTPEAIKEFAYEFARQGYGIDLNHDNVDVQDRGVYVVEYFLARAGDPLFAEGAFVVGMKIDDDEIWQQVLNLELNGFSFEAECMMLPVQIQNLRNRQVVGVTDPDPSDGHTHEFLVILDPLNRPVAGATGVTQAHSHKIVSHTKTETAKGLLGAVHSHRFQVISTE